MRSIWWVWRDAAAGTSHYGTTPSFGKAFESMREGARPSVQVLFRWRVGPKEGDGCVSFVLDWHPAATERLVEGVVTNLITAEIARSLAAGRFILARVETGGEHERRGTNAGERDR